MTPFETGTLPGTGTFRCTNCEYTLSLAARDELPECPSCGGTEFARASLFTAPAAPSPQADTEWLGEVREHLDGPGQYVAFEHEGRIRVVELAGEWTRIGRSLAADIRFDDPTVSRRHALLVRGPDGVRVLDDRSLNGVWVNGKRVEWSAVADGDEILVGRHLLRFVDVPAPGRAEAPAASPASIA